MAAAALSLAACGENTNPGPTDITAEEAEMLDEAAAMLDERQANFEAAPAAPVNAPAKGAAPAEEAAPQ